MVVCCVWVLAVAQLASHQLACSFQVCRVQSPQRLVTWEHLGKVCGMNAGGGGRRQATALCYVITPPLRNLVVLSISTKALALSSCCPPCMSLQHARRRAKRVESIWGSWERHTSYRQRAVSSGAASAALASPQRWYQSSSGAFQDCTSILI